jgi:hypothetical protein
MVTLKEFKELTKLDDCHKKWFELFEIRCLKCNSTNIEINGGIFGDSGYYGSYSCWGKIIIKCHSCGNAKIFEPTESFCCQNDNDKIGDLDE